MELSEEGRGGVGHVVYCVCGCIRVRGGRGWVQSSQTTCSQPFIDAAKGATNKLHQMQIIAKIILHSIYVLNYAKVYVKQNIFYKRSKYMIFHVLSQHLNKGETNKLLHQGVELKLARGVEFFGNEFCPPFKFFSLYRQDGQIFGGGGELPPLRSSARGTSPSPPVLRLCISTATNCLAEDDTSSNRSPFIGTNVRHRLMLI